MSKKELLVILLFASIAIFGIQYENMSLNAKRSEIQSERSEIEKIKGDKKLYSIAQEIYHSDEDVKSYMKSLKEDNSVYSSKNKELQNKNKKLQRKIKALEIKHKKDLRNSVLRKYRIQSDILTDRQKNVADEIAYITASNYNKYGILPSIAVGQAMQETTLGTAKTSATSAYGYWGVIDVSTSSTYKTYGSLEEAVLHYLSTLNNGRYAGALFNRNVESSLNAIQRGKYCIPSAGYADRVLRCIIDFDFTEYDRFYIG